MFCLVSHCCAGCFLLPCQVIRLSSFWHIVAGVHQHKGHYWLGGEFLKTTHCPSRFLSRISSRFHGASISSINITHEIQTGWNQSSQIYIECPVLLIWTLLLLMSCTFLICYILTWNKSFIVGDFLYCPVVVNFLVRSSSILKELNKPSFVQLWTKISYFRYG